MTGQPLDLDRPDVLQPLLAQEGFIRRLARGLLFDEHRVDDLVQQTWLAALRRPPAEPRALRAWLTRVVRGLAANEVRTSVRRATREAVAAANAGDRAELPSADEVLAREELRARTVGALQRLAEPYRTALALRYLEGLEPTEIAERLGVPAATVRSHVRRGLDRMRAALDADHGGDRRAWSLPLVPLAWPETRDAAATVMATTTSTLTGVLAVHKLIAISSALAVSLLAWWAWPDGDAPADGPITTAADQSVAAATQDDEQTGTAAPAAGTRSAVLPDALPTGVDSGRPAHRSCGLRGRILTADGQPAIDLALRVLSLEARTLFGATADRVAQLPGFEHLDLRTDDEGRFFAAELSTFARFAILVEPDGGPHHQLLPIDATPRSDHDIDLGDLQLAPRGSLHGRVVDAEGRAIAGAEVLALDLPPLVFAALPVHHFDPDFGVLVTVPRAQADALTDPAAELSYSDQVRTHLNFRLGHRTLPAADDDLHAPLVLTGGPVRALWDALPITRAQTDTEGQFVLEGAPLATLTVIARASGHAAAFSIGARLEQAAPRRDLGDVVLGDGVTASGLVVDAHGVPVAGAEVRVASVGAIGYRGVAPVSAPVTTDATGRFEVAHLPEYVMLCAVARRHEHEPWAAVGPLLPTAAMRVQLPAAAPLDIVARGPDGEPVSITSVRSRPTPPLGALARIGCTGAAGTPVVQSDPAEPGRARVMLTAGTWTLEIETPRETQTRVVALPRREPLLLTLAGDLAEHPVVVRTASGVPVADAEVACFRERDLGNARVLPRFGLPHWPGQPLAPAVRTDANGRATLLAPTRTALSVVAWHSAKGAAAAILPRADATGPSAASRPLEIVMPDVGGLAGVVEPGPDSTIALTDLRVELGARGVLWAAPSHQTRSLRVDADGRFEVPDLPVGEYDLRLLVAPPGAAVSLTDLQTWTRAGSGQLVDEESLISRRVSVTAGETTQVALALATSAGDRVRITGTVHLAGEPAQGCTLWLRQKLMSDNAIFDSGWETRARAEIGADGTFAIEGMPRRAVWIGVRLPNRGAFVHEWQVTLGPGPAPHLEADIELGQVAGVLRLADGTAPPTGTTLTLNPVWPRDDLVWTTDAGADGAFRFEQIPVGPTKLFVSSKRVRTEALEFDVLAGALTPPLELTGVLLSTVTASVRVPPAPTGTSPAGKPPQWRVFSRDLSDGGGTHVEFLGEHRTLEWTAPVGTAYRLEVWSHDQQFEVGPDRIVFPERSGKVELTVGAPIQKR